MWRLCLKWEVSRFGSLFFFTNQLLKLGQKSCSNASRRYQRGVLCVRGMGAKIEGSLIGQKVEDVGMP